MKKSIPIVLLATLAVANAELKLPAIIGDNMVLQQKQANPIWGWDTPGTEITVSFAGQTKTAKADDQGKWTIALDALPASAAPATMTFKGTDTKEAKNVLVGEVWLCSGQSNMGFSVGAALDGDLEIMSANFPQIRLVSVPNVGTQELQPDFKGRWDECNPKTVGGFSAVGFFYGRLLHQILGVPIGLIDNAWGGSAAEAWVKRDLFDADPRFKDVSEMWKKIETSPAPTAEQMNGQSRPGNLYAGCLYPIIGYGIRGTIWYQGESNAGRAFQYDDLMKLLITEWRRDWKQGDFPFYFVQLADFQAEKPEPGPSAWAALREAQTKTMNTLGNTGQAVIIDIGEGNDIHPRNKRDVAERLARWALAKDYGVSSIPFRSPEYKSMQTAGNKAIISFDHTGGGLRTLDIKQLRGFAICGEDQKWVWADANFIGDKKKEQIEVGSPQVPNPVAVRYAWADNPVCNVFSEEGLPLTPFRTDRFELPGQPR